MVRNTPSRRRGFTLIELLLVMVILAVLAGIAVPIYIGRAKDARLKATESTISNIKACLTLFEHDCDRFPTTEEGLEALVQQPNNVKGWNGPYLEKGIPMDPWGNAYNYRTPSEHKGVYYDLYSNGPDGQEGTGDDIVNWQQ